MKRNEVRFFLVGALALLGLPASAADAPRHPQPTVQAQEARLESSYKTLATRSTERKFGAAKQAEISRQKNAIREMIRRLEAGEQVAPGEVDRVLQVR